MKNLKEIKLMMERLESPRLTETELNYKKSLLKEEDEEVTQDPDQLDLFTDETVTKYLLELHLVKIEVDKDSIEEGYMEYRVVESEEVPLGDFDGYDDYDEARELFKEYEKRLA